MMRMMMRRTHVLGRTSQMFNKRQDKMIMWKNTSRNRKFKTTNAGTQSFAEKAHVDTMVYVGAASFVGIVAFNKISSLETRENMTLSVIDG